MKRKIQATRTDLPDLPDAELTGRRAELFSILRGERGSDGFYNGLGVMLNECMALLAVDDDRVFWLVGLVNGKACCLNQYHKSNPRMIEFAEKMTVFGPSPRELEQQERERRRASMTPEEREAEEIALRQSWGQTVTRVVGGVEQRNHPDVRVV